MKPLFSWAAEKFDRVAFFMPSYVALFYAAASGSGNMQQLQQHEQKKKKKSRMQVTVPCA